MALSQRLEQRQSQSLVMTPQLQQAIKLLQLSGLELNAYVEEQLRENPLLEADDGREAEYEPGAETPRAGDGDADGPFAGAGGGGSDGGESDGGGESADSDLERYDTAGVVGDEGNLGEKAADLDVDYGNVWDDDSASAAAGQTPWGSGGGFDDDEFGIEQTVGETPSLRDHLGAQLNLEIGDPVQRAIGLLLIDQLDEAGYMRTDLDEIATDLGCEREVVAAVLDRLQRFDPPGIFARSLGECLALQLRDRNRLDPAMQALLDNLEILARRDFAALQRVCGVDRDDLAEMVLELRRLDPKPALAFHVEPVQTVVPDILMRPDPNGGWLIELNSDALPRVLVNARYYAQVRKGTRSREDREYVTEQFHAANWLVKSLHQRATTILKVAVELVRQQDAFFAYGVQYLRPLTLRDIAEAIGMHESTVSRVTTNKYIATPRGLFELKYFFTASIASAAGGEAHSAEAVRFRIKALIDGERVDEVLSDDRIVEILRGDGIDIARRTVAKYREAMRIPSSVQRRRERANQL